MSDVTFGLFKFRRFLPLFVSQYLGVANDNLFKNAMALLIIYKIGSVSGTSAEVLTTIATGLFMLPYFLFSALAGQLADRYEKSRLMKIIKFGEIAIVAIGGVGLALANVTILLFALFLLGSQSTFFAPVKYAVLPEYLRSGELVSGTALVEGGTFLAILTGTIVAGVVTLTLHGITAVIVLMMAIAIAGFSASLFLPKASTGAASVGVSLNPISGTVAALRTVRRSRDVFLAVLGISWFWAVGAVWVTEFPAYAKNILGADEQVVTLMLAMFSIGIGAGSVLCGRLMKGEISPRFVPFGAIGMAIFSLDLYFASGHIHAVPGAFSDLATFMSDPSAWRIMADLLLTAGFGGLYIVPLYAILQSRTIESERARAVAANNIVNSIFIVTAAGISAALLADGLSVTEVFLIAAVLNVGVAICVCRLLPDELLRVILARILRLAYGVEVKGLEHLRQAGERVVIVANHVSYLDAVLVSVFIPGKPVFAIDTRMSRKWWIKPLLRLVEAFPLDPTNPLSIRTLTRRVQAGAQCVIFPEGKLTRTGALMKIYNGPGMIADRADATLVPLRIEGAQYTPFSRLRGKLRIRWFPKITMTLLPPQKPEVPATVTGRKRRQRIGALLYDTMSKMMVDSGNTKRTLFQALLDARRIHGGSAPMVEDIERKPMGLNRLVTVSLVLGRLLARVTQKGENVGVLLPNVTALVGTFFGLQAYGRVPAMLNYSTGVANMVSGCTAAGVKLIVTSRRFVAQARLDAAIERLGTKAKILWLEDLRTKIGLFDKLFGLVGRHVAGVIHARQKVDPAAPALILFTSGSEGTPKGVVLSHSNLLANCQQMAARVDFNATDRVFNALPLFHSFGMTGGLILPLFSGVRSFLYPSPLHYRIVPELVYDTNATIFFATNTFLTGYARQANPYDFYNVRYVFAGAEKIEDETRRVYFEKFGLRILEGYGATETAPVIAVNTPMHFKSGTVGRLMPGLDHRIEPVEGIAEGGRLLVRGPNVMLGYLRAERPETIEAPADGWYDTGDVVTIDGEGFVKIVGRVKRFAKLAGEMISLGAVEALAAAAWAGRLCAAVTLKDAHGAEKIALVTDEPTAARETLIALARKLGVSALTVPKMVMSVEKMPLLGTGKIDYPAVTALMRQAGVS